MEDFFFQEKFGKFILVVVGEKVQVKKLGKFLNRNKVVFMKEDLVKRNGQLSES